MTTTKSSEPKTPNRSSAQIAADAFGKLRLEEYDEFVSQIEAGSFGDTKLDVLQHAILNGDPSSRAARQARIAPD